jgi:hypothetical protein
VTINQIIEAASSAFNGQVLFDLVGYNHIKFNDPNEIRAGTLLEFGMKKNKIGKSIHKYDHV